MPSPAFALKGKKVDKGVTNIRNVELPHWRRWLGPASRCLVPFTSFSENDKLPDGRFEPVWFALDENRPLAFFAGIWTTWTSTRKLAEGEVTLDLFGFLTTDANARGRRAFTRKAMPVILTRRGGAGDVAGGAVGGGGAAATALAGRRRFGSWRGASARTRRRDETWVRLSERADLGRDPCRLRRGRSGRARLADEYCLSVERCPSSCQRRGSVLIRRRFPRPPFNGLPTPGDELTDASAHYAATEDVDPCPVC